MTYIPGLTDAQLRATPVPVSVATPPPGSALDATVTAVTTSLGTDGAAPPSIPGTGVRGYLRSIFDKLSASLAVTGTFWQATQPVSGPLTDAQLRATRVPVDGSGVTQPVSGPLTDTQLRASAVPVTANIGTTNGIALDGTDQTGVTPPTGAVGIRGWMSGIYNILKNGTVAVTGTFWQATQPVSGTFWQGTQPVSGPLTDAQLRASKVPVTSTSDGSSHGTSDLAADDVIKWAGTTLSVPVATAPDGSQTAPVVRPINRKSTTIETTTVLAGAASFTGAWHDSNATGDNYVTAYSYASHVGAAFTIEESDDTGNPNLTRTVATWSGAPSAVTLCWMVGVIRARWWRVKYTNGATLQTSWELTTCASSVAPDDILTNSASGAALPQAKRVVIYVAGGAVGGTDNAASYIQAATVNAAGSGPQDVAIRAHGGKFSGTAAATKSGASFARTPTIFKQVTATASGDTAVWTPLTGNKFRLLKFKLQLTSDAIQASGGRITILLRDATTDIGIGHVVYVPAAGATALNASYDSGWIDLGQFGYQSTAANAALNVNLSAALTGGVCNVIAAGTEE